MGGIIALAGVGALQYAGYWPGSTATRTLSATTADVSGEVETLQKQVARLEAAAQTPPAAVTDNSGAISDINDRLSALTTQSEQFRNDTNTIFEQQISSLESLSNRLQEAETKLNAPRQDVAAAQALSAAALKAAIDRGGPFATELETFGKTSPDDPAVSGLQTFASEGVPSREALAQRVTAVADKIVEATNQPPPDQSWSERFWSGTRSLVKVRPVGEPEGDSAGAIAARLESKVQQGNLTGAATEWEQLPPEGKTASADFKQELDARIKADQLVSSALTRAVTSTTSEE